VKYVKVATFLILAVAGILFGIANKESATVHFFWYTSKAYPLYLVLYACFLAGTLTAILFGFLSGGDMNSEERHLNKRIKDLQAALRQAQANAPSRPVPGDNAHGPSGTTP
jgi:uncharacterized integral membrane protein